MRVPSIPRYVDPDDETSEQFRARLEREHVAWLGRRRPGEPLPGDDLEAFIRRAVEAERAPRSS